LSSEFEAAIGSFMQKLVVVERVRYKTRWKNRRYEITQHLQTFTNAEVKK